MSLLSTLRSYAADPCRWYRWRFHRALLSYKLIKRRHPGSPLGYTAGVDKPDTYVYIMHKEPVEADDGNCWFGYKFYLGGCLYCSYFWIWNDEALRVAHRGIMVSWRERMLGKFGLFWKLAYRLAAKFSRYNDGSFRITRCISDFVAHGYIGAY